MTFDEAMVELVRATDSNGVPVHLYRGNWTADSLRETTRAFMRDGIDPNTMWLTGFASEAGAVAALPLSSAAEAAYWENLAKLATATAAAIREGR